MFKKAIILISPPIIFSIILKDVYPPKKLHLTSLLLSMAHSMLTVLLNCYSQFPEHIAFTSRPRRARKDSALTGEGSL